MNDPLYIVRWLKDGRVVNDARFANLGDAKLSVMPSNMPQIR